MCGLAGILNKNGERFSGEKITLMVDNMKVRYDGRGGGFAAYGIYPKYKNQYALHIFIDDIEARERTEEFLKGVMDIVKDEEVPTANISEIPKAHETWRYFVDVPNSVTNKDDYVVKIVMRITDEIDGSYVASSGKNLGVFKAAGMPCDVARLFEIDRYKGYCWTAHGRFPTNTRGWWGGAHPFNLLDWCVVHNGEISSYGTNKRYLETYGYKCKFRTDTEVITYLFDLLVRKHGLSLKTASMALTPPFWKHIDSMPEEDRTIYTKIRMVYASAMLNGPFGIIVTNKGNMIGLNDRIKLRPLIAAQSEESTFIASEESAIRTICNNPEEIWAPKAGTPVIAKVEDANLEEV